MLPSRHSPFSSPSPRPPARSDRFRPTTASRPSTALPPRRHTCVHLTLGAALVRSRANDARRIGEGGQHPCLLGDRQGTGCALIGSSARKSPTPASRHQLSAASKQPHPTGEGPAGACMRPPCARSEGSCCATARRERMCAARLRAGYPYTSMFTADRAVRVRMRSECVR